MLDRNPFFIVGCVRSGTTFLRDVLRKHPALASPEETHFFRWSEPFGTSMYMNPLRRNVTLKKHRELDQVSEDEFENILQKSTSKAHLYENYMQAYLNNNNLDVVRWFDKTPQNVFGLATLCMQFPSSKFIHIVRNPLDVIASLKYGKVIHIDNVIGSCNYWIETLQIISVFRKAYPERLHEISYESLISNLDAELAGALAFLEEEFNQEWFLDITVTERFYDYHQIFTAAELAIIQELCTPLAETYGYSLDI